MWCVIIDSCENGLQRIWLNLLCQQLLREGHKIFVRPTTHPLHHVALQNILAEFEDEKPTAGELVAVIEQDCWPWRNWADPIVASFANDPKLGVVGAQHGWRNFGVDEATVVTGFGHPRGEMVPLPDNLAAWFSVLHRGRLREAGLSLRELNWCADGFAVERNKQGLWIGKGGDTGARVAAQVRDAGLAALLIPTMVWPGRGFGGLCKWTAYEGEDFNHHWIMYHHFYGRQIGRHGELSVGHHRLTAEDVTAHAVKFMELFMEK